MNIEDVARCIEDPSLCKAEYIADLESLIAKYPYSQSFPLLLLKTLGAEKSLNFDDALNAHAFRISDRVRLYELIQAKEENTAIAPELIENTPVQENEETIVEEEPVVPFAETLEETVLEESTKEFIEAESIDVPEDISEEVNDASTLESIQDEIINDFSEMTLDVEPHFDENIVAENILEIVEEPVSEEPTFEEITQEGLASEQVDQDEMELKIELVDEDLDAEEIEEELEVEIPVKAEEEEFDFNEISEAIEETIEDLNDAVEIQENSVVETSFFDKEKQAVSFEFNKDEDEAKNQTTSEALAQSFHLTMKPSTPEKERLDETKELEDSPTEVEHTSSKKEKKDKKEKSKKDKKKDKEKEKSKKDKKKEKEKDQKEEKKSDKKKKKKKFSSWLHPENAPSKTEKSGQEPLENKEETPTVEPVSNKAKSESIIDNFIEKDPKIRRFEETLKEEVKEKVPFYSPLEKAKESINEDIMPVSETLAKIYVAQGNYPKAIVAYNQLMLLFPEKKIFFADQIRKLEQNTN